MLLRGIAEFGEIPGTDIQSTGEMSRASSESELKPNALDITPGRGDNHGLLKSRFLAKACFEGRRLHEKSQ